MVTDDESVGPAQTPLSSMSPSGDGTPVGAPPPLTGTPRENADRLFERIMTARARGDAGEALRFTPMAIAAYAMAAPLDDDGLYHLASVHLVAGDTAAALSTAEQILARNPDHLLGLGVAAETAVIAGDTAAARAYYTRLLAAYDAEVASGLQEYRDHSQILPEYRATARSVVNE